jgi:hypothetical protein
MNTMVWLSDFLPDKNGTPWKKVTSSAHNPNNYISTSSGDSHHALVWHWGDLCVLPIDH